MCFLSLAKLIMIMCLFMIGQSNNLDKLSQSNNFSSNPVGKSCGWMFYCSLQFVLICIFSCLIQPKIDEDHPSWLHLRIRGFDPRLYATNGRGSHLNLSDHMEDGRWTLGFPAAQACEDARVTILNQMIKQRSAAERILAPLLQDDYI